MTRRFVFAQAPEIIVVPVMLKGYIIEKNSIRFEWVGGRANWTYYTDKAFRIDNYQIRYRREPAW